MNGPLTEHRHRSAIRPFRQDSTCVGSSSPEPVRTSIALIVKVVSQSGFRRADNALFQCLKPIRV